MGIGVRGSALTAPREDIGVGFDEIDLEALRGGYVGFAIAPIIEAKYKFGTFRKMKMGQMLQPRNTIRNPDGSFARIDADFEIDTYRCHDHGLEMLVDYSDAAAYADIIDSEMVAADFTRHGVIEGHEQRVIAVVDAITPVPLSSGDRFDVEAATVTKNFATYKQTFRMQCGYKPNALVLDTYVIDQLMENSSVQDKFVGAASRTARDITLTGLAMALGLDEIIEANAVKNTVAAPKAVSLATSWPQAKALLFRKSTAPTTMVPQFMRTIHWSGNGSRPGCAFEQYEEPQRDGTVLRHRLDVEEKVMHANFAMVLSTIVG